MNKDERDRLTMLDKVDLIHDKYKNIRQKNLEMTKLDAFNLASNFILNGLNEDTLRESQELDHYIVAEQRTRLEEYKISIRR
ncbi:hypothetical protein AALJ34_16935 [Paraclostridium bifermentans]|uniref:hypothetical protein n=1 Tax=Paraclostridium bifermentans TaxID=1490 RepID=UPI001C1039AF|nr:hypothetical protein [Paraclostridium bifermentans]MBU5290014.1 hypothetical protein [Paraclostridium bifermentans]